MLYNTASNMYIINVICMYGWMDVQVNASSSVVDAAVMGLQLDELELASLRGEVQEVSLNLNFDTRVGRGKVNVAGPRFSGLQGEALSGGVRWERDVIRLEKAVLQQRTSRYPLLLYLPHLHCPGDHLRANGHKTV